MANLIRKVCQFCGAEFFRPAYKVWARAKYCSYRCAGLVKRRPVSKRRAPREMLNLICEFCKEPFRLPKSQVGDGRARSGRFCSRLCAARGTASSRTGPLHYAWKGGQGGRPGNVIRLTKRLTRERGVCATCGATHALQGHHIMSYASRPDLAMDETNIIVLCTDCHATEHGAAIGAFLRGGQRHRG